MHFAGDSASAYQLTQWLWPLGQLAAHMDVGIVCRSARTAQAIAGQTDLPVRFARRISDLDAILGAGSVRCVLYVNQATQNFHALRYPRPAHVHLSHGESEKSSMVSNQLKAYDYVLTAGQAARDRITDQLIGFADDRMIDVGRPQLDAPAEVPQQWSDHLASRAVHVRTAAGTGDRSTILWAPTWEGDSPSMAYGTLPVSGPLLVDALASAGAHIIYRPHPRTGFLAPQFRAADDVLRARVSEAGGFVDTTPAVGWQFAAADACIAEMSSVAFDWLATGKPLALIRPADEHAQIVPGGLFDRVPSFPPESAAEAVAGLRTSVTGAAHHYLGSTAPGAQLRRFIAAVLRIAENRSDDLGDRDDRREG